jgi:hypothetical protein
VRSDRVMQLPVPPRRPGTTGRPRKHGGELALADPATWPDPQVTTSTATSRYGMATATAWDRVHPRLTHRAAWLEHDGPLPVIEGTLIRLQVDHLPGDRDPKPVWLWFSATGTAPDQVDRCWQAYLRRFDLEHTFRLFNAFATHCAFFSSGILEGSSLAGFYLDTQAAAASAADVHGGEFAALDLVQNGLPGDAEGGGGLPQW